MMQTRPIDGQTIVVTGASSGIGCFIAEGLARLGATVVVAARSAERAALAIDGLPGPGRHRHLLLDLSDRASIEAAGDRLAEGEALDGLALNAGIVAAPPARATGAFGAERCVDVNVLAQLELLRRALPALERAPEARIVWTGSTLTRRIPFDAEDWLSETTYRPRTAYAMSKHASEMLGFELDRRLRAAGSPMRSVVTHPGSAIDALTPDRPAWPRRSRLVRALAPALGPVFASIVQGKDAAAQSSVAAITASTVPSGGYLGPENGMSGAPVFSRPVASSLDPELGAWLWRRAEARIGHRVAV